MVSGVGGQQSNISSFDQGIDSQFGKTELTAIFKDLGGIGDASLSDTEAQKLADYVLDQAGSETVDYEFVMTILDDDGDNNIDTNEVSLLRAEQYDSDTTDGDNVFTLGGAGAAFTFEFKDEYEDDLAKVINANGGLDAAGLQQLLMQPEQVQSPKIQSVIAMALLAVGLDENEVSFIMNELVSSPTTGAFTVQNLIEVAESSSAAEEQNDLSGAASQ